MSGPCAKRPVECEIIAQNGDVYIGRNDCENPQARCPRLDGEGYDKCKSVCRQGAHAEIRALEAAGSAAPGSRARLIGHYYICEPCGRALREAGVQSITIELQTEGSNA